MLCWCAPLAYRPMLWERMLLGPLPFCWLHGCVWEARPSWWRCRWLRPAASWVIPRRIVLRPRPIWLESCRGIASKDPDQRLLRAGQRMWGHVQPIPDVSLLLSPFLQPKSVFFMWTDFHEHRTCHRHIEP